MYIKIKKLHEEATIPKYQTIGSAGFDIHSLEDITLNGGETKLVRTGLAFEIPSGYELQIRPRSGLTVKTDLRVANSPGTIDSDFRGEVMIILSNISKYFGNSHTIRKGDRIAQGVLAPVITGKDVDFIISEELTSTNRGTGGFGSTGV